MRECGRFYEIWLRHLWLVFQCWIKYAKKEAKKAGKKGRRAKRAFRAITISTHRRPRALGGRRAKRAFRAIPIFTYRWPCAVLPELFFLSKCGRKGKASEASLPSYSDFYALYALSFYARISTSKSAWRKASEASLPSYYALLNLQPFVTIVSC